MAIFLSTYTNNIDKKNRVSVPVGFRNIASSENFSGIVAYQSIKNLCIEACGMSRIEHISQIIENLDPFSEERDAFETIMLGGMVQLAFDSEGRIMIPKELLNFASIDKQACFVGKGQVFEIWNPESFDKHQAQAKLIAKENRNLLKNIHTGQGAV